MRNLFSFLCKDLLGGILFLSASLYTFGANQSEGTFVGYLNQSCEAVDYLSDYEVRMNNMLTSYDQKAVSDYSNPSLEVSRAFCSAYKGLVNTVADLSAGDDEDETLVASR